LYGSLFAAIGAAVDNETDTQQFMLPITIPLILGLFVMINSFLNPSGKLAVWFSIIPLTSPIVMMARIPFEVPVTQLLASAAALILTFLGTTWLAAKIYRTGILMYGKKISYRELWKWIKY
jgi:ABC-2 type transport system permease protein